MEGPKDHSNGPASQEGVRGHGGGAVGAPRGISDRVFVSNYSMHQQPEKGYTLDPFYGGGKADSRPRPVGVGKRAPRVERPRAPPKDIVWIDPVYNVTTDPRKLRAMPTVTVHELAAMSQWVSDGSALVWLDGEQQSYLTPAESEQLYAFLDSNTPGVGSGVYVHRFRTGKPRFSLEAELPEDLQPQNGQTDAALIWYATHTNAENLTKLMHASPPHSAQVLTIAANLEKVRSEMPKGVFKRAASNVSNGGPVTAPSAPKRKSRRSGYRRGAVTFVSKVVSTIPGFMLSGYIPVNFKVAQVHNVLHSHSSLPGAFTCASGQLVGFENTHLDFMVDATTVDAMVCRRDTCFVVLAIGAKNASHMTRLTLDYAVPVETSQFVSCPSDLRSRGAVVECPITMGFSFCIVDGTFGALSVPRGAAGYEAVVCVSTNREVVDQPVVKLVEVTNRQLVAFNALAAIVSHQFVGSNALEVAVDGVRIAVTPLAAKMYRNHLRDLVSIVVSDVELGMGMIVQYARVVAGDLGAVEEAKEQIAHASSNGVMSPLWADMDDDEPMDFSVPPVVGSFLNFPVPVGMNPESCQDDDSEGDAPAGDVGVPESSDFSGGQCSSAPSGMFANLSAQVVARVGSLGQVLDGLAAPSTLSTRFSYWNHPQFLGGAIALGVACFGPKHVSAVATTYFNSSPTPGSTCRPNVMQLAAIASHFMPTALRIPLVIVVLGHEAASLCDSDDAPMAASYYAGVASLNTMLAAVAEENLLCMPATPSLKLMARTVWGFMESMDKGIMKHPQLLVKQLLFGLASLVDSNLALVLHVANNLAMVHIERLHTAFCHVMERFTENYSCTDLSEGDHPASTLTEHITLLCAAVTSFIGSGVPQNGAVNLFLAGATGFTVLAMLTVAQNAGWFDRVSDVVLVESEFDELPYVPIDVSVDFEDYCLPRGSAYILEWFVSVRTFVDSPAGIASYDKWIGDNGCEHGVSWWQRLCNIVNRYCLITANGGACEIRVSAVLPPSVPFCLQFVGDRASVLRLGVPYVEYLSFVAVMPLCEGQRVNWAGATKSESFGEYVCGILDANRPRERQGRFEIIEDLNRSTAAEAARHVKDVTDRALASDAMVRACQLAPLLTAQAIRAAQHDGAPPEPPVLAVVDSDDAVPVVAGALLPVASYSAAPATGHVVATRGVSDIEVAPVLVHAGGAGNGAIRRGNMPDATRKDARDIDAVIDWPQVDLRDLVASGAHLETGVPQRAAAELAHLVEVVRHDVMLDEEDIPVLGAAAGSNSPWNVRVSLASDQQRRRRARLGRIPTRNPLGPPRQMKPSTLSADNAVLMALGPLLGVFVVAGELPVVRSARKSFLEQYLSLRSPNEELDGIHERLLTSPCRGLTYSLALLAGIASPVATVAVALCADIFTYELQRLWLVHGADYTLSVVPIGKPTDARVPVRLGGLDGVHSGRNRHMQEVAIRKGWGDMPYGGRVAVVNEMVTKFGVKLNTYLESNATTVILEAACRAEAGAMLNTVLTAPRNNRVHVGQDEDFEIRVDVTVGMVADYRLGVYNPLMRAANKVWSLTLEGNDSTRIIRANAAINAVFGSAVKLAPYKEFFMAECYFPFSNFVDQNLPLPARPSTLEVCAAFHVRFDDRVFPLYDGVGSWEVFPTLDGENPWCLGHRSNTVVTRSSTYQPMSSLPILCWAFPDWSAGRWYDYPMPKTTANNSTGAIYDALLRRCKVNWVHHVDKEMAVLFQMTSDYLFDMAVASGWLDRVSFAETVQGHSGHKAKAYVSMFMDIDKIVDGLPAGYCYADYLRSLPRRAVNNAVEGKESVFVDLSVKNEAGKEGAASRLLYCMQVKHLSMEGSKEDKGGIAVQLPAVHQLFRMLCDLVSHDEMMELDNPVVTNGMNSKEKAATLLNVLRLGRDGHPPDHPLIAAELDGQTWEVSCGLGIYCLTTSAKRCMEHGGFPHGTEQMKAAIESMIVALTSPVIFRRDGIHVKLRPMNFSGWGWTAVYCVSNFLIGMIVARCFYVHWTGDIQRLVLACAGDDSLTVALHVVGHRMTGHPARYANGVLLAPEVAEFHREQEALGKSMQEVSMAVAMSGNGLITVDGKKEVYSIPTAGDVSFCRSNIQVENASGACTYALKKSLQDTIVASLSDVSVLDIKAMRVQWESRALSVAYSHGRTMFGQALHFMFPVRLGDSALIRECGQVSSAAIDGRIWTRLADKGVNEGDTVARAIERLAPQWTREDYDRFLEEERLNFGSMFSGMTVDECIAEVDEFREACKSVGRQREELYPALHPVAQEMVRSRRVRAELSSATRIPWPGCYHRPVFPGADARPQFIPPTWTCKERVDFPAPNTTTTFCEEARCDPFGDPKAVFEALSKDDAWCRAKKWKPSTLCWGEALSGWVDWMLGNGRHNTEGNKPHGAASRRVRAAVAIEASLDDQRDRDSCGYKASVKVSDPLVLLPAFLASSLKKTGFSTLCSSAEFEEVVRQFIDPEPDVDDDYDGEDLQRKRDESEAGKPPAAGESQGKSGRSGQAQGGANVVPPTQAEKDANTLKMLNAFAAMTFGKLAHCLLASGGRGYKLRTNFKRRVLCHKIKLDGIDLSGDLSPDLHLLITSLYDPSRHDRVTQRLAALKITVPIRPSLRMFVLKAGGCGESETHVPDPNEPYMATIYNFSFLSSFFVKRTYNSNAATTNAPESAPGSYQSHMIGNGRHAVDGNIEAAAGWGTPYGAKCRTRSVLPSLWVTLFIFLPITMTATHLNTYDGTRLAEATPVVPPPPCAQPLAAHNVSPFGGLMRSAVKPTSAPHGVGIYNMTHVVVSGNGSLPDGWTGHVSTGPGRATSASKFPDLTEYEQEDIYVTAHPGIKLTNIRAYNNTGTAEAFTGGIVAITYDAGRYQLEIQIPSTFEHALLDTAPVENDRAFAGKTATATQRSLVTADRMRASSVLEDVAANGTRFAVGVRHGTQHANLVSLHWTAPSGVDHYVYGNVKVSRRLNDALSGDPSVYARWLLMFRQTRNNHPELVADYASLDDPNATMDTDRGASMLYALTMLMFAPDLGGHLVYSGGFVPYCQTLYVEEKARAVLTLPTPSAWTDYLSVPADRQLFVSDDLRSPLRARRLDEAVALSSVSNLLRTMPAVFEAFFPADHLDFVRSSGVPMPYISQNTLDDGGASATARVRGLEFVAAANDSAGAMRDVLKLVRDNLPLGNGAYTYPPAGVICEYSTLANYAAERTKRRTDNVLAQAALMFETQPNPSDFEGDDRCNSQPSGALTIQTNTGGLLNFFGVASAMSSYDPSSGSDVMVGRMNAYPRMLAAQSSNGSFWPYASGSTVNGVPLCPNMPVSDGIMSSHTIMSGGNLGALVYALQPTTFTTGVFNGFENTIIKVLDADFPRHQVGKPVESFAAPLGFATPPVLLRFLSSSLFQLPVYLSPAVEVSLPAWSIDSTLPATLTVDCPTAGGVSTDWLTIKASTGMLLVNAIYGGTFRLNVSNSSTVTTNVPFATGTLLGTIWISIVCEGSQTSELGTVPFTKVIESGCAMYAQGGTVHEVGYTLAFDVPITGFVHTIRSQVRVVPVSGVTTSALTPSTAGGSYTVEMSTFEPVKQLFPVARDLVSSTLAIITTNSVFSTPANVRTTLTMPVQKGNLSALSLRKKYEVSYADMFRHTGVQNVKKLLELKASEVVVPLDSIPAPDHLIRARPLPGDEMMSTGIVDTLLALLPIVAPLAKTAFNHFAPPAAKAVVNAIPGDFAEMMKSMLGHMAGRGPPVPPGAPPPPEETAVRDRVAQRALGKLRDVESARAMLERAIHASKVQSDKARAAKAARALLTGPALSQEQGAAQPRRARSGGKRNAPAAAAATS